MSIELEKSALAEHAQSVAPKAAAPDPFETFLAAVPEPYVVEYAKNPDSDELVVVVSADLKVHKQISNGRKNVVYIADPTGNFFLRKVYDLVAAINALIAQKKFRNAMLMGGSKAGYSAIMLTMLCARANRKFRFGCLAFSPHTQIYPENPVLRRFSSYSNFLLRIDKNPALKVLAERMGNVTAIKTLPNAQVTIVYGENHLADCAEARRLIAPNIRKYPIPFNFHSSVMPFLVRGQRAANRENLSNILYHKLLRDNDARDALPVTPELFFRQIEDVFWIPPIDDFIDQCMPNPPAPAAPVAEPVEVKRQPNRADIAPAPKTGSKRAPVPVAPAAVAVVAAPKRLDKNKPKKRRGLLAALFSR